MENMMDQRLKQHPLGFWEIAAKPMLQVLQQYYADKYYQEGKRSYALEYAKEELNYFREKLGLGRDITAFLRPKG